MTVWILDAAQAPKATDAAVRWRRTRYCKVVCHPPPRAGTIHPLEEILPRCVVELAVCLSLAQRADRRLLCLRLGGCVPDDELAKSVVGAGPDALHTNRYKAAVDPSDAVAVDADRPHTPERPEPLDLSTCYDGRLRPRPSGILTNPNECADASDSGVLLAVRGGGECPGDQHCRRWGESLTRAIGREGERFQHLCADGPDPELQVHHPRPTGLVHAHDLRPAGRDLLRVVARRATR